MNEVQFLYQLFFSSSSSSFSASSSLLFLYRLNLVGCSLTDTTSLSLSMRCLVIAELLLVAPKDRFLLATCLLGLTGNPLNFQTKNVTLLVWMWVLSEELVGDFDAVWIMSRHLIRPLGF
jgi:hypothetical protein